MTRYHRFDLYHHENTNDRCELFQNSHNNMDGNISTKESKCQNYYYVKNHIVHTQTKYC